MHSCTLPPPPQEEKWGGEQLHVKLIMYLMYLLFPVYLYSLFDFFRYFFLQHIIQDKMAYSPILIRLDCGSTPDRPLGFWEFNGLGLMGMYKSDWDRVGGMNVKEFKNKWGGEDWELSDRILQAGLEIERIKMMHLFHYFHSRQHMWVDTNMTVSDISDKYWY